MTLNELQRLAEGASSDWSGPSYLAEHAMSAADANFVEAMSPDTAMKLIAVARELLALRDKPVWEHIEAEADAEGLRNALEELKRA